MLKFTPLLGFNLFGCFITLLALFLTQQEIVDASSFPGLGLNFAGGLILALGAVYGVFIEDNQELIPSIILNTVWCILSATTFLYKWRKPPSSIASSSTLPLGAERLNPANPACAHDHAVWKSVERDDGRWEWESSCDICGTQTWHMPVGFEKTTDENGNIIYVQKWHAKKT